VGRERDEDRRGGDRYLGVPKLPEAAEIPEPVIDSTDMADFDTVFMRFEPETLSVDTTFPADTIVLDSVPAEPFTFDTLTQDTISGARRD
jgi:hypothetical protein